ncbi:MAG: hypothetical protein JRH20_28090 [Deltaproteobacteria bacterium]|nr:hypothetical protein [Deltaproteobacteria bacterium]
MILVGVLILNAAGLAAGLATGEADAAPAQKQTPEEIRAKYERIKQIPVSAHVSMMGTAGGVFGPAANPGLASMAVGARLSVGFFLSPRFALEVEGGLDSYAPELDPETQTGPESIVWSASLALRWYPNPIHRERHFHPYLIAGAGYRHLRLFIRDEQNVNPTRFTASGAGIHVGVGATVIVMAVLSVEVRLVYRAFRFGTKDWHGPVVPIAKGSCGGTGEWGHMLSLEFGSGMLF